jgi:hypothetical protein
MKKVKSLSIFTAIIVAASSIFFTSCKKSKPEPEPVVAVVKNNIAYIYKTDNTDGLAYKTLLEDNDCHVTLIDKAQVATTVFTAYQLIVIDNNTDIAGLSSSWTTAETAAIEASSKPMLLMGVGGLQYASKIGNKANYLNTAFFSDTKFFVTDKTSTLYTKPYTISIPVSTPAVTLYNTNVVGAAQYVAVGSSLDNVSLFGKFNLAPNYYPLAFEKNRYFSFGFARGVDAMTGNGRNFMVNLAYYVGGLTL